MWEAAVSRWRVHLEQSWTHDGSTLHVMELRAADDSISYLCSDGAWRTASRNTVAPEGAGIFLPREAVKALVDSLAPDATAGEMGVLREALGVERRRVDEMLRRLQ